MLVHNFDDHLDWEHPWRITGNYAKGVLSTSLVNTRKHGMFNSNGGVVISAVSKVLCSYPNDGGAMTYEDGCGPRICRGPDDIWGCAFPVDMLKNMLEVHEGLDFTYNEVVVEASSMVIEAVFTGDDGDDHAEFIHRRMLEHFRLNANQLPLLRFDNRPRNPFYNPFY